MEYFVLEKLKQEVYPGINQFGGLTGCGTNHYLIEAWDYILETLDSEGTAVNLISIDFAKAFNSMSHQACVKSLEDRGASVHMTRLVGSFLTNRQMQFKAGEEMSSKRTLRGGSPQGTLLGNFMFVMTTDQLEKRNHGSAPTSTPVREGESRPFLPGETQTTSGDESDISSRSYPQLDSTGDSFVYMRHCRKPFNRLDDTDYSLLYDIRGRSSDEAISTLKDLSVLKYVDDFLGCEAMSLKSGFTVMTERKTNRFLHAKGSEEFFNTVDERCSEIGMKVNSEKTQLLTISPATTENVSSYIKTRGGDMIQSQETLMILGFVFGRRPSVQPHLDHLANKFRTRLWSIRHLKFAGLPEEDLLRLYQVLILPVLDYGAVVYHSQLNNEQTTMLEKLQTNALKVIYGFKLSREEITRKCGIESLWERRERLMQKFVEKQAKNPRFADIWFPQKTFHHMDLRKELIYEEKFAKTDRLYKSPKYHMRRRLNGGLS